MLSNCCSTTQKGVGIWAITGLSRYWELYMLDWERKEGATKRSKINIKHYRSNLNSLGYCQRRYSIQFRLNYTHNISSLCISTYSCHGNKHCKTARKNAKSCNTRGVMSSGRKTCENLLPEAWLCMPTGWVRTQHSFKRACGEHIYSHLGPLCRTGLYSCGRDTAKYGWHIIYSVNCSCCQVSLTLSLEMDV